MMCIIKNKLIRAPQPKTYNPFYSIPKHLIVWQCFMKKGKYYVIQTSKISVQLPFYQYDMYLHSVLNKKKRTLQKGRERICFWCMLHLLIDIINLLLE